MGVLGVGGTGKSTLIKAIRTWFRTNGRGEELIVIATTGSAAVKINGSTVHSAVSIPIESPDGRRMGKLKKHQREAWEHRQYVIIDEVSMLDSTVIVHLHSQLAKVKANPEINFGGINTIFFSDFL
jgi:thymidylate kinase